MKTLILTVAAVAALSGCVVAPIPHHSYYDSAYSTYPTVESSYRWEPTLGVYYFHSPRGRVYMDRGWTYRDRHRWHGPRGQHPRGRGHDKRGH